MTPIAETRIPVKLDRERVMIFDANTMCAFDEATGKFYWDTMLSLFKFYEDHKSELNDLPAFAKGETQDITRKRNALLSQIMHYISSKELRALVWAAVHEYDKHDEPVWPLTLAQIGRYIKPQDTFNIVFLLMRGHNDNAPTKAELGEASGPQLVTKDPPASPAPKDQGPGGEAGIELPADAFTSEIEPSAA